MGSLFRSEEMAVFQLFIESEAVYSCVSELGELGLVQFRDLNSEVNSFQRKFVNEVRRCDEMERKLRYLEKEMKKNSIPITNASDSLEAPQPREMLSLEATILSMENGLREVNDISESLNQDYLQLTELKHILRKTQGFFDEADGSWKGPEQTTDDQVALLGPDSVRTQGQNLKLGFVAGVIPRKRIHAFERMLWRACRGNVFLRQAEIEQTLEDPSTGDQMYKSVFIIFFYGDQLKNRVTKICEGFRATLYPIPESPSERREMAMGVMTRIEDLNTIFSQTKDQRHRVLVSAKNVRNWFVKVRKVKAIYHTLNMFSVDVTQKCLIAECWLPVREIETIQMALRRGMERSGSLVPPVLKRMDTFEDPPTFNKTNKFTHAFQALIDAYGIAKYREVNPAPYTIVTFPFLFGVMFGDLGHGIIMFLFALWMVLKEKALLAKKSKNEIWNILFGGRYIILMMGCFSMYAGIIYNDVFGKSFNVFGSHWKSPYDIKTLMDEKELELDPKDAYKGTPYPVGVDPVWQIASNKIVFLNAYKMKISIIIGVCHMLFGVSLSVCNYTYFKNKWEIVTMFLPQIIFLVFLFFYMVFLMFFKWIMYAADNPTKTGSNCAPSILITFINMVLFKIPPEGKGPCSPWMYPGQSMVQAVLVICALLCVPWMLVTKPYLMMRHRKKQHRLMSNQATTGATGDHGDNNGDVAIPQPPHEEVDMMEFWIHQAIHTIEYVLGSVSHTASYLRLWALSLAHAQLSEVLWIMVMKAGLNSESLFGAIILWPVFAFWAVLTIAILVLMEGLSAFLHTLRLHWVEFQSKFYAGSGYTFIPFSFEKILDQPTDG